MPNSKNIETQALNLLEKALSLPNSEQEAFLKTETSFDDALRTRVMSLWNVNEHSLKAPSTGSGLDWAARESRPLNIGSFKIIDELGSGGMGSVYLGRKETDDFTFDAAIKVVRKDSLSDTSIERLKLERRILANLRHPNIAHFYDGGEIEHGHPFFVMEHVKGQKLFDYLQKKDMSALNRLAIFKDICAAVAFAHQNLVIHRDLTPANILVSKDGVTKLIDFGIAHTLGDERKLETSEKTGTLGYIAPERRKGVSASTITDIFSLGVIFKELLENTTYPRKSDLIAIANKSSNDVPENRYQSVDALLQDLHLYEAGKAVNAVESSWYYSTKRFIGRHRLVASATTSIFVISLMASVLISISYFQAEMAEERSRNRFNEVRELANFMMFELYDEVEKLDTSLTAREMLVETTLNYLDRLSELPEAPQDLQVELALGYQRMADVTGGTGAVNFGKRTSANNLYAEAKAQIDLAYVHNPNNADTIRAYSKIYRNIGTFEWISNLDFEEAGNHFSTAKDALENLLNSPHANIDDHVMDGALALGLSQSARNVSDFDKAIAWAKNGIEILNTLHLQHPEHYETQFNLAHAYIYLGEAITTQVYEQGGEISRAILPFDKGKYHLKLLIEPANAPTLAKAQYITALYKRSYAACQIESLLESTISDLEEAEQLAAKLMDGETQNNFVEERLLSTLETHADCYLRAGKFESALVIAERLVRRRQEKTELTPNNPLYISRLLFSQLLIAKIFNSLGEFNTACDYFKLGDSNAEAFENVTTNPQSHRLKSHIGELRSGWNSCQSEI